MPGMGTGHGSSTSSVLAIAFHRSILHQWFIVLGVSIALFIVWNLLRLIALKNRATRHPGTTSHVSSSPFEPRARRFLRIAFGGLWLFDGLLQSQPAIPASLANTVIKPVAGNSSAWTMKLSSHAISVWNNHPVTAATAVFWIEIGLGIWLLSASRGALSRLGGYASASWALVIWILAEVFGGLFAPGYSWLFGAPGAALVYLVVGVLVGLPDRFWRSPRLGIEVVHALGAFLIAMAIVQAWPNRGFWQGRTGRAPLVGTVPGMLRIMEKTSQPHLFKTVVARMATISMNHGFALNLAAVLVLGLLGAMFLSCTNRDGRIRVCMGSLPLLPFVLVYVTVSLLVWVSIQDLGFFGGVGTDPNSMIPIALVLIGGDLAARGSTFAEDFDRVPAKLSARVPLQMLRSQIVSDPNQSIRTFVAFGALLITLLGAIPMIAAL